MSKRQIPPMGPVPPEMAEQFLNRAVEAGYLEKDGEDYGAPIDTYEWCADLVQKNWFFRGVYVEVERAKGIDLGFVCFCLIECQTGRWGDPAVLMPGIAS
ncbi:MAG TPA: hypothetical protein ACFE0H_13010 [Elainellaceae cyanobacterium]